MNEECRTLLSNFLRILAACFPNECKWLILLYKLEKLFDTKRVTLIHFVYVLVPTRY
jgi:hypothetical protein